MPEPGLRKASRRDGLSRRQRRRQALQQERDRTSKKTSLAPTSDGSTTPATLRRGQVGLSRPAAGKVRRHGAGQGASSRLSLLPDPSLSLTPSAASTGSALVPSDRNLPLPRPRFERDPDPGVAKPRDRAPDARPRPPRKPVSPIVYALRLLILGVGLGVIGGTLLASWDPAHQSNGQSQAGALTGDGLRQRGGLRSAANNSSLLPTPLKLSQEVPTLKAEVQALANASQNAGLTAGFFFADVETGDYVDFNGSAAFSAASMIKVPVLVAFFQDVDAGKIRLDEQLTMRPDLIASESGEMQYQPPNTKFSALETATNMIVISDNTATNMLIDRLGGIAAVNQRFRSWGLTTTALRNPLPDLKGTNITSPRELATLMAWVGQGDLLSMRSRDRMLSIMRQTVTRTLLPQGLGEGATISHKTGDIGTFVGDVGLIDAANGRRYVAMGVVKRPFNDPRAQELIRQVSRTTYKYFNRPSLPPTPAAPATSPTPMAPTAPASPASVITGTPTEGAAASYPSEVPTTP